MRVDLSKRFWSKVAIGDDDACWPFIASCNNDGYGNFRFAGRIEKAHRTVWFLIHGEWPTAHVLHRCDNPPCCNPHHLFTGTHLENIRDCIAKGRFNPAAKFRPGRPKLKPRTQWTGERRGEWCSMAKLLPADVLDIRARYAAGTTQTILAKEYRVDQSAISNIVRRRNWSHI